MIDFDYPRRLDRLRALMNERSVDAVVLSVGADLPYFTGYEAHDSERLTALVVRRDGEAVLLVPELEAPKVHPGPFDVQSWRETDNPVALAAAVGGSPDTVAVGDHMWSAFLLGFQSEWRHATWGPASELTRELRIRKDDLEVAALRAAARGVDRVMGRVPDEVRFAGRTEIDVARDLAEMTIAEGHESAEFTIVASGPNGASPHHDPGDRVLEDGDLVVCDFGGRWDGYYSDSTRTFSVGEPTAEQVEVHAVVHAANHAGRTAVAPGVPCQDIDRAARRVIDEAGFGDYFIHRTGHGIGLEVHEHPYMVEGNELPLEPSMTFSVEPGVYLPDRFGVRLEDIIVVDEGGGSELNLSDRGLARVD